MTARHRPARHHAASADTHDEPGGVATALAGDATMPRADAAIAEAQAHKVRVYLGGLVCAIVILVISWLIRAPGDAFLAYGYPAWALLFAGFAAVLWWRLLPLRQVELALFACASALVLARLAWLLFLAGPIETQLLVLAGGHYWAVAALLVTAFVMLDRRSGLVAASVVLAVSVGLTALGVWDDMPAGDMSTEAVIFLIRVHVFLALLLVLITAVAVMHDRLQDALTRAAMHEQWAHTDALTGLANRRAAEVMLEHHLARMKRYHRPATVILVDIDNFKSINDSHGHAVGDSVIQAVGRALSTIRDVDLVARWGGDEFLIITPEIGLAEAARLAERCRRALAEMEVEGATISATFGVARIRAEDSSHSAVARADAMLYKGKAVGRNRVFVDDAGSEPASAGTPDCR